MTTRIRKLSPEVIDRIAAGEVVERPAAVVKELVENALDAGATRIDVEVRSGGRDLIAVRDDGTGMGALDLEMALESHATSKLADVDDLEHIASFGFRGEALASIAGVSDTKIVSRELGAPDGFSVQSNGGSRGKPLPCPAPEGTLVEVRHLFKYVPARRKFLRTPATELAHVTAVVHRLALANLGVGFSLKRDSREAFRVAPVEGRRDRLGRFFGRDLANALLPVNVREGSNTLEGYVARPEAARSSGRWQHLFLNGRPIRDRRVGHAVRHAFEGLLTVRRHPVSFLFLEMDPAEVDVNVHPAKTEVRFRDGDRIHRLVRRAVRDTLLAADLAPNVMRTAVGIATPGGGESGPYIAGVKEALSDFLERPGSAPPPRSGRLALGAASPVGPVSRTSAPKPVGKYLQVAGLFLVFERGDELVVVDQHALHERILLEELSDRVRAGKLEVQQLLLPTLIELPAADVELLLSARDEIGRLGLQLDRFGETEVAVHALPTLLAGRDPKRLVDGLLERLRDEKGAGTREGLLDTLLHSMACRGAIMAGDRLTEAQCEELMRRADLIDTAATCAHGRPTSLKLPFADLRKHFGR